MPFVFCALVALQLQSPAQSPTQPSASDAPSHRVDFTQVDVVGQLQGPGVGVVWARPKGHRRNLIALRSSFRPELFASRDALTPGTR